jgi:undecaprenyl-diphosphatase
MRLFNKREYFLKRSVIIMILLNIIDLNSINISISLNFLPLIFVAWLIYIWIKKDDEYMDIVLYSVYAGFLGFIINMILGYFLVFNSINVSFMLSIALMLTYFKETRKSGLILLILGLTSGILYIYLNYINSREILLSIVLAFITTIIIYYSRNYLIELNQILKAAYYVLK